jgi:hypothetical protein
MHTMEYYLAIKRNSYLKGKKGMKFDMHYNMDES